MLIIIDLAAVFDIAWTIYLGNFDSWTLYNLSVVGYWLGHEWELRIWGWVTAVLFVSFLIYLFRLWNYKGKAGHIMAAIAGIILSIGVVIPYQLPPNETSFISNMHIACSLMAPLLLVACMCCLMVHLVKQGYGWAKLMIGLMVILLGVAAYFFIKYTIITTVLELYTVSAISAFMTILSVIGIIKKK